MCTLADASVTNTANRSELVIRSLITYVKLHAMEDFTQETMTVNSPEIYHRTNGHFFTAVAVPLYDNVVM